MLSRADLRERQAPQTVRQPVRDDQAVRVEPREVEGSSRLELGGVEAVRDDQDRGLGSVGVISPGRVVVLVGVGPARKRPRLADIHAVDLDLESVVGRPRR